MSSQLLVEGKQRPGRAVLCKWLRSPLWRASHSGGFLSLHSSLRCVLLWFHCSWYHGRENTALGEGAQQGIGENPALGEGARQRVGGMSCTEAPWCPGSHISCHVAWEGALGSCGFGDFSWATELVSDVWPLVPGVREEQRDRDSDSGRGPCMMERWLPWPTVALQRPMTSNWLLSGAWGAALCWSCFHLQGLEEGGEVWSRSQPWPAAKRTRGELCKRDTYTDTQTHRHRHTDTHGVSRKCQYSTKSLLQTNTHDFLSKNAMEKQVKYACCWEQNGLKSKQKFLESYKSIQIIRGEARD